MNGLLIANLALSLSKLFGGSGKSLNKLMNKLDSKNFTKDGDSSNDSLHKLTNDFMNGLGDSIKNRTKDLILQFPILCSDSISMETATTLSKVLEYEYASRIGMAINTIPATSKANTIDFLKQFHQNIYSSYFESYNCDKSTIKSITETSRKLSEDPIINESSLNKVSIAKIMSFNEARKTNAQLKDEIDEKDKEINKLKSEKDELNNKINSIGVKKEYVSLEKANVNEKQIQSINGLSPTIVKAQVFFIVSDDKNQPAQYSSLSAEGNAVAVNTNISDSHILAKDILFGVKSSLHLLKRKDVVKNLSDTARGSNFLFKLIKWRSGEIRLVKDLILMTDVNKKMANNVVKDGSSWWWKKLETIANDKRIKTVTNYIDKIDTGKNVNIPESLLKNKPIPTATMIITKEDSDAIYNLYGIDILNDRFKAYDIMKHYFLMNFIIVDEATEIVYIYDENTKRYENYSLSSLKTKSSSNSKSIDIKDLIPLFKR